MQELVYKRPNHFESLDSMRVSGELCDVTIQVKKFLLKDIPQQELSVN